MKLTEQEIHNIGMNRVGKELESLGYEFLGVNSNYTKHPQFVVTKKGEGIVFVMVKTVINSCKAWDKDEKLIQRMENHSKEKKASLWFAGVELINETENKNVIEKEDDIVIKFNGFELLYHEVITD